MATTTTNEKVVICIGDIHGYINKLKNLWSNLERQIKPNEFESAHVIFLGDYCDMNNLSQIMKLIKSRKVSLACINVNNQFSSGYFDPK